MIALLWILFDKSKSKTKHAKAGEFKTMKSLVL